MKIYKHKETERERRRFENRKVIVEAIQCGERIDVVARMFKVSKRSIFFWLALYRQGGWDALREGKRTGRPTKVSPEVIEWLFAAICENDPTQFKFEFFLWSLSVVRSLLLKQWNVTLSISGVSRLLAHMGLTPQRPKLRGKKRDDNDIADYIRNRYPEFSRRARALGATMFFIDEAGVRTDQIRRTTWGREGVTPIVKGFGGRHGYNVISAVAANGHFFFAIYEGSMNTERFMNFLVDLCNDNGKPIFVIADNVSYHNNDSIREFANDTEGEISIEFLPVYAPELNPDEFVWAELKGQLSKLVIASKAALVSAMETILQTLRQTKEKIVAMFMSVDTVYAS
jgi:transposase